MFPGYAHLQSIEMSAPGADVARPHIFVVIGRQSLLSYVVAVHAVNVVHFNTGDFGSENHSVSMISPFRKIDDQDLVKL